MRILQPVQTEPESNGRYLLSGRIAADLKLREAARALGLEKFPQPTLVAGPLVVDGASIGSARI